MRFLQTWLDKKKQEPDKNGKRLGAGVSIEYQKVSASPVKSSRYRGIIEYGELNLVASNL